MSAKNIESDATLRILADVPCTSSDGFETRTLFTPASNGSHYLTFSVVTGRPGARGESTSLRDCDVAMTIGGQARFWQGSHQYSLNPGTAIAPRASGECEVVGDADWVALVASCRACPLKQAAQAESRDHSDRPLVRRLDEIEAQYLYGFERRLLFSPGEGNHLRIRFAEVRGFAPASSKSHTHIGDEIAYTLSGHSRVTASGQIFDLRSGTGVSVPPNTVHQSQVIGSEPWTAVVAYCDECPLLREQTAKERAGRAAIPGAAVG